MLIDMMEGGVVGVVELQRGWVWEYWVARQREQSVC